MAVSEHRPNSPAMPATTNPSTAQTTPVPSPPQHPPSSSAQPQPSDSALQTASSAPQIQGHVAATTPAPPAPASTTRELRPRPAPEAAAGAPATPLDSGNAEAFKRTNASKKSQISRHRTANAKRVTQSIQKGRRTAKISKDQVLKAGTRHGRRGRALSAPVRRGRRDRAASSVPSPHEMVTRSRGSVTRTYQQMEAEAERAIRKASWRRRARRRERERQREERRCGEGSGAKRARVQQVMNPTGN